MEHLSLTESKIIRFLFAVFLALGIAVPLQAQIIVLRSGGSPTIAEKYPRGSKLDMGSLVTLPDQGWIKVLRSSSVESLRGPGTFALGEHRSEKIFGLSAAEKANNRIEKFLKETRQRNRRPRGEPSLQNLDNRERRLRNREQSLNNQSPNLWHIDFRYSRVCVLIGEPVNFWRSEMTNAQAFTIREMGGESLKQVSFSNNIPIARWPESEIPFSRTESKTYEIFQEKAGRHIISVVPIEVNDQNDAIEIAERLIENRCEEQLVALERALE